MDTSYIAETEGIVGHARTLLVGDLNMNPFEDGVMGSEALHATMSRQVAATRVRIVSFASKPLFYNPMWQVMGSSNPGPQGTHYYSSADPMCFFWNTFDQVLVRPDLLERFDDSSLSIVTQLGPHSLLNHDGLPDDSLSDHLPITFSLVPNFRVNQ